MSKQTTKPSDGLVPWTYGGHRFLLSPEGEVWHEIDGKPSGKPLASLSLKQAQAQAKRDPSLRRATLDHTRPREDGRPGLRKEPPLPLVFEEAGIRQVRFVCGMPKGSGGRVVPDPIPLHGDETTRWVLVSSDRDGLLLFHAPSVAYQQVTHGRNG
jgi:hypothetical protein